MNKTVTNIYNSYKSNQKNKVIVLAFAVAFFIVRAVQMILQVSVNLAYPGATLYLIDFNFYLGTRTFIGSILTLLTPHITYQQIFILNLLIYVILILTFLFLLVNVARKAISENNNVLFLILLVFITFPYSLLQYAGWIGAYDVYLCLFAVLGVVAALVKRAHWFLPLICVMAIFTHYSFAFAYFPAVLSVHIYCAYTSKDKKSRIFSMVLAFVSSLIATIYCVFFADNTVKMNRSELLSYMENRMGMPVGNVGYLDFYYFNDDVFAATRSMQSNISNQGFLGVFALIFLPTMLLFGLLWVNCIIKLDKKQIVPLLCFLGTEAVNVALVFAIPEYPRWFTAGILSQFMIIFVLIKKEYSVIIEFFERLNRSDRFSWLCVYEIVLFAVSLTIKPYDVL